MDQWLYVFEAKEIQKFILAGDKLKDMIGGSDLINDLCGAFLKKSLEDLGYNMNSEYELIRSAGGAGTILFYNENAAKTFYSVWPFLVDQFVPGIQVIQGLKKVIDSDVSSSDFMNPFCSTMTSLFMKDLEMARNTPQIHLPDAGPMIDRCPRTGLAAVDEVIYENESPQYVDKHTKHKREHKSMGIPLIRQLDPDKKVKDEYWPERFDNISGPENAYLAIIHADGNNMGRNYQRLSESLGKIGDDKRVIKILKGFSSAISESTWKAARYAFNEVILADFDERKERKDSQGQDGDPKNEKVFIAARPIVIGGEDLTIIVRSDLAFKFLRAFLGKVEESSKQELDELRKECPLNCLPKCLTSCAGIAFVKKAYPFSGAYGLAESLCDFSKKNAKDKMEGEIVPSCFAFHRVTASIVGDYAEIRENELMAKCSKDSAHRIKMWFGPYAVGRHASNVTNYQDLDNLAESMENLPRTSLRTLIQTLYDNPEKAENDLRRILAVAESRNKDDARQFQILLKKLTKNNKSLLWDSDERTPLLDAWRIVELERENKDIQQDLVRGAK